MGWVCAEKKPGRRIGDKEAGLVEEEARYQLQQGKCGVPDQVPVFCLNGQHHPYIADA